MPYKQKRNPIPLTGCGRRRPEEMTNPFRKASRGPISKVCLPKSKIDSMSEADKRKVINAKKKAKKQGKIRRDSSSNVKHSGGSSLHAWFNKDDWRQVGNPDKKCGEA